MLPQPTQLCSTHKAKAVHIRDPHLWSRSWNRREMWMSLTVIVYSGGGAPPIERRPSHFHPLSFHLSHRSKNLQYKPKQQDTWRQSRAHWGKVFLQSSSIILCLTHLIDYKTDQNVFHRNKGATWNEANAALAKSSDLIYKWDSVARHAYSVT